MAVPGSTGKGMEVGIKTGGSLESLPKAQKQHSEANNEVVRPNRRLGRINRNSEWQLNATYEFHKHNTK